MVSVKGREAVTREHPLLTLTVIRTPIGRLLSHMSRTRWE